MTTVDTANSHGGGAARRAIHNHAFIAHLRGQSRAMPAPPQPTSTAGRSADKRV
jgi:hypothetical protein